VYNRDRSREWRRYQQGIGPKPESRYVTAEEAHRHLRYLQSKGVGVNAVSAISGINKSLLTKVRSGNKKFVDKRIETKILSVRADQRSPRQLVSDTYSRKLIAAMRERGLTSAQINVLLGRKPMHNSIINGKYVTVMLEEKLEKAYIATFRHLPPFKKSRDTKIILDKKAKKAKQ
jgi:hypothetical protein